MIRSRQPEPVPSLAGLPGVVIEDAALAAKAMDWAEGGMDFADALHLVCAGDCEGLVTFGKRFVRAAARVGDGSVTLA